MLRSFVFQDRGFGSFGSQQVCESHAKAMHQCERCGENWAYKNARMKLVLVCSRSKKADKKTGSTSAANRICSVRLCYKTESLQPFGPRLACQEHSWNMYQCQVCRVNWLYTKDWKLQKKQVRSWRCDPRNNKHKHQSDDADDDSSKNGEHDEGVGHDDKKAKATHESW
jgi:hypothetical protein